MNLSDEEIDRLVSDLNVDARSKSGVSPSSDPPFCRTVALYETNRAYGGPEEGGWWYDVGERVPGTEAIVCHSVEEVAAATDRLATRVRVLGLNAGRHELTSVLCDGWIVPCSFAGANAVEHFPEERPIYA